jgi:hypothetical protein
VGESALVAILAFSFLLEAVACAGSSVATTRAATRDRRQIACVFGAMLEAAVITVLALARGELGTVLDLAGLAFLTSGSGTRIGRSGSTSRSGMGVRAIGTVLALALEVIAADLDTVLVE